MSIKPCIYLSEENIEYKIKSVFIKFKNIFLILECPDTAMSWIFKGKGGGAYNLKRGMRKKRNSDNKYVTRHLTV